MNSPERGNSDYTERESPYRKLAYIEDFKRFVTDHPETIASFRKINDEISYLEKSGNLKTGDVFEEGDLKITIIGSSGDMTQKIYDTAGEHLKVEIANQKYFVKRVYGFFRSSGVQEFKSLSRAKEILKRFDDVEVVDYQLGYQDKKGITYFISKWSDGMRMDEYLKLLYIKKEVTKDEKNLEDLMEEIKRLEIRVYDIRSVLGEFWDMDNHNILYDPNTKKLTVFDIHSREFID
jgi:hypothetical protein